jgi:hypothetical protein
MCTLNHKNPLFCLKIHKDQCKGREAWGLLESPNNAFLA